MRSAGSSWWSERAASSSDSPAWPGESYTALGMGRTTRTRLGVMACSLTVMTLVLRGPLPEATARRFGDMVAQAAAPIDDVRGSAAYRRHSLAVMARRTLAWAWRSYQREARQCA